MEKRETDTDKDRTGSERTRGREREGEQHSQEQGVSVASLSASQTAAPSSGAETPADTSCMPHTAGHTTQHRAVRREESNMNVMREINEMKLCEKQ